MSLTSVALVWMLVLRRKVILKKLKLRNILPRHVHKLSSFFSKSFVIELLVLSFHVPPFMDYLITTHEENIVHVNMYNFLVLVKSYTFFRTCRNHSGFYGSHTSFIGNLNGVDSMSVVFNFRMLLKYKPRSVLLPLFALNVLVMSACLVMVERSEPDSMIQTFWDACYVSIITISTFSLSLSLSLSLTSTFFLSLSLS